MNFLSFKRLTGSLAIVLTMQFSAGLFGQEKKPTTSKQPDQPGTLRFDSVQILDRARRLSNDARSLEPLDEIPLQARLADAVWDFDQPLAERLLTRSLELTIVLLTDTRRASSRSISEDPQLLYALISAVAERHDGNLQEKLRDRWNEARAAVAGKGNETKSDPAQMANVLLRQSTNYLKSDEQKARQLFRESVSLRVTQDHAFFLLSQRQNTHAITDTLFGDTLDVLAQRPIGDANELLMLSSYLFSPNDSISYLIIGGYNAANITGNLSAAPKNPALAKRYLRLFLTKVNANELTPPAVAHYMLKNLVPQYQSLAPDLLNEVYAMMATLLPSVSKQDSEAFDYANKGSNDSESDQIAEMEKRIEKSDNIENDDRRDFEYFTILFGYLVPRKDFTRSLMIVSRITNQDLREKSGDAVNLAALSNKLENREAASSIPESDLKFKTPLARVVGLSTLGHARLKQKATGDALRLFEQAAGEANHIKEDQDRIQAKLMLVQLFLDLDPTAAFEKATEAFKQINKFPAFDLDRSDLSFSVTTYGLSNGISIPVPGPSSFLSTVTKMCRANCESTFQTCDTLEKKEVRLRAALVAVQTGLHESTKKPNGALR